MRHLRIITTLVFLITLAAWSALTVVESRTADQVPPVIESDSEFITVSVHDDPAALMEGLTASDDRDGDLTDQIIVGKQTKFVRKGTTEMTFLVFDSSNNMSSVTRTVTYKDYESPVFSLDRPLVYGVDEKITLMDRISATDCIQGRIDDKVRIISSNVNRTKPGVYSMGVEVSNRFGDLVTVELPINVVPATRHVPQITLSEYLVNLHVGDDFNPRTYLKTVELPSGSDGALGEVEIESDVDMTRAGTYQALYSYTDAGGHTGWTSLTVVVRA